MSQKKPAQETVKRFGFGFFFLTIALVLPISLSLTYQHTNTQAQAEFEGQGVTQNVQGEVQGLVDEVNEESEINYETAKQIAAVNPSLMISPSPVISSSPTPTPAMFSGKILVEDAEKSIKITLSPLTPQADPPPTQLIIKKFKHNPLTNEVSFQSISADGVCNNNVCTYDFYTLYSANSEKYWQSFEFENIWPGQNPNFENRSQYWSTDDERVFYRTPIILGDRVPSLDSTPFFDLPIDRDLTPKSIKPFQLSKTVGIRTSTGQAAAFKFAVNKGEKINIYFDQYDAQGNSTNYEIETYLYKPNGDLLDVRQDQQRRIFEENGTYYLIVNLPLGSQNLVFPTAYSEDVWNRNIIVEQIKDLNNKSKQSVDILKMMMEWNVDGDDRIGRLPFEISLKYPLLSQVIPWGIDNTNSGLTALLLGWQSRSEKIDQLVYYTQPQSTQSGLKVFRVCAAGGDEKQVLVGSVNKQGFLNPADYYVVPNAASGEYFPPGYNYKLVNYSVDNETNVDYVFKFSTISPSGQLSDINNDGQVDLLDYTYIVSEFDSDEKILLSDLDCSGSVDLLDYTIFTQELLEE